jgi:hypothetical protein
VTHLFGEETTRSRRVAVRAKLHERDAAASVVPCGNRVDLRVGVDDGSQDDGVFRGFSE